MGVIDCKKVFAKFFTFNTLFNNCTALIFSKFICLDTRKVCLYTRNICLYTRNICLDTRNVVLFLTLNGSATRGVMIDN